MTVTQATNVCTVSFLADKGYHFWLSPLAGLRGWSAGQLLTGCLAYSFSIYKIFRGSTPWNIIHLESWICALRDIAWLEMSTHWITDEVRDLHVQLYDQQTHNSGLTFETLVLRLAEKLVTDFLVLRCIMYWNYWKHWKYWSLVWGPLT